MNETRRFKPGTATPEKQRERILADIAAHVGERWPALPAPELLAANPALIIEAAPAIRAALDAELRAHRLRTEALRMLFEQVELSASAEAALDHVTRVATGGA